MKADYFKLIIGIATLISGCGMFIIGFNEYSLDKEFKNHGVKTEAKLIGYQYWESKRHLQKGDRPVFTYTSSSGVTHKYIAYEYGAASAFNKETLATKKIIITYLPRNEKVARVDDWYFYKNYLGFLFGTILFLLGAGLLKQTINPNSLIKREPLDSNADPIQEAEVYISYGRKNEAIEILKIAKLTYPNRIDIGKKLDELLMQP